MQMLQQRLKFATMKAENGWSGMTINEVEQVCLSCGFTDAWLTTATTTIAASSQARGHAHRDGQAPCGRILRATIALAPMAAHRRPMAASSTSIARSRLAGLALETSACRRGRAAPPAVQQRSLRVPPRLRLVPPSSLPRRASPSPRKEAIAEPFDALETGRQRRQGTDRDVRIGQRFGGSAIVVSSPGLIIT